MPTGMRKPATVDNPLKGKPKRPCASCGNLFQPTVRRRMLCHRCFKDGD